MSSEYSGATGTLGQGYSSEPWGESYGGQRFGQQLSPGEAAIDFLREYARERPEIVAMWAFGVGFVLGWKLKPW
jgi:hypothetical protein